MATAALALLLLLALARAVADPCVFEAFQPTTREKVMQCYEKINKTGNELDYVVQTTVDNIIKYEDVNVFSEYYLNSTFSHMDKEIDLVSELNKLKLKPYTYEYQFHWDVVQLMLSLKDPHSVYRFPTCFTRIYHILPFAFNSRVEGNTQSIYLSELPADYSFVTVFYQKNQDGIFEGADELIRAVAEGMTVDEMRITYDKNYYPDMEEDVIEGRAVDVIRKWADMHGYISRNSSARFNSALRSDFFLHASDFGIPFYDIEIKVGSVWFSVPWIAVPTQTIGGLEDLENISPLKKSDEIKSTFEGYSGLSLEEQIRRIKRLAEERMIMTMSEKPLTPKVLQRSNATTIAANNETIRGYVRDNVSNNIEEGSTLTRIYIGDEISLRKYSTVIALDDGTLEPFKAYVISIPSFSPNYYDQFTEDMQKIFDYIENESKNDQENTTIIIDLRENGGGYVDLGNKLLYYLVSPDVDTNSSGYYMRKKCALNDYLAHNKHLSFIDGDDGLYDYYSHTQLDPDNYYLEGETQEKTFNYISNGTAASKTVEYMSQYTFSPLDFYDYSGQRRSDKGDQYNSNLNLKYYFEVNDENKNLDKTRLSVIAITDGTCGSTCATFLNHAIESNAVTVVGVGGLYEKDEPLTAASFAGGSVLDSLSFEQVFEYLGIDSESDPSIPKKMPRDNYIRFPYNALMSFRDPTVALEFEQHAVSYKVPYFTPLNLNVVDSIKSMLDTVIPAIFGTKKDETSPINSSNNYIEDTSSTVENPMENARYGYFFDTNTHKFSDTLEVVGCKEGFYPVYDAENPLMEKKIVECVQLEETQISTGDWLWIAILFIVLAIAVCVVILVYWLIQKKKGRNFGDCSCGKGYKKNTEAKPLVEEEVSVDVSNQDKDHSSSSSSSN